MDGRALGEDMRGCADGMRDGFEAEGAGLVLGLSGRSAGKVLGRSPPGGRAMGCSGRTGSSPPG
jgi:hypothetical protein